MTDLRDLQLARKKREEEFAFDNPPVRAHLTTVNGSTKVLGQPGWVWAIDQNNGIIKAFNPNVADRPNLPVLIRRTKARPGEPAQAEVIDVDWEFLSTNNKYDGQAYIKNHAADHEWRNGFPGPDAMYLYPAAWAELMVTPSSGLTVNISPLRYIYGGSLAEFSGARDVDLSAYQPASGLARLVLISVARSAGTLDFSQGDTRVDNRVITLPRPTLPAGVIPAAYVRLSGDAASLGWRDIINARSFVNGAGDDSASETFYDNSTSGLAATTVQAAIDEVALWRRRFMMMGA